MERKGENAPWPTTAFVGSRGTHGGVLPLSKRGRERVGGSDEEAIEAA